ncbi:ribosome recycling factor [Roseospirillum parvum]|uniref:Ribosome-recycling factor n=1 Tax=Roseospirillum parvum TaxID=83401 RepID=A0A1G7Y227_9PROT|nr:ribosome recycling factor [Roseospirillum parvum]SDG90457.1 ribosome recycling factor [Roseospirillum parvum]
MSTPEDFPALKKDIKHRMDQAAEVLRKEFAGLRTGRAHASLLDPVTVEAYGQPMPLNQVATIGVPEPRMLTATVWDKGMVKAVEKAIRDSGLGLNPAVDGTTLRIPIPALNEERRQELTKVAGKYTEEARVAIRNVRRHGMDSLKKMEKDGHISEDEHHRHADEVQKLTDQSIKHLDEMLAHKEQEIMQV